MNKEKYSIRVNVRQLDGGVIRLNDACKPDTLFELEFSRENAEQTLRKISNRFKEIFPNKKLNISASVLNGISGTYMEMFSFYSNEDRFISY